MNAREKRQEQIDENPFNIQWLHDNFGLDLKKVVCLDANISDTCTTF